MNRKIHVRFWSRVGRGDLPGLDNISLTEKKLIVAEEKAIKAEETLASEKLKMLNATKNMLAEGLTIEQVRQISGLSIEELSKL